MQQLYTGCDSTNPSGLLKPLYGDRSAGFHGYSVSFPLRNCFSSCFPCIGWGVDGGSLHPRINPHPTLPLCVGLGRVMVVILLLWVLIRDALTSNCMPRGESEDGGIVLGIPRGWGKRAGYNSGGRLVEGSNRRHIPIRKFLCHEVFSVDSDHCLYSVLKALTLVSYQPVIHFSVHGQLGRRANGHLFIQYK
jgi:hypothetical protein